MTAWPGMESLAGTNFMVLHQERLSARNRLVYRCGLDCEMQFVRLNSHKGEEKKEKGILRQGARHFHPSPRLGFLNEENKGIGP